MPFYFDTALKTTSNGSGATESPHLNFVTVANQRVAAIRAIYGSARFGTAGGGGLRAYTYAVPSTGGTTQTPQPKDPGNPAADLTAVNDGSTITPGTTPTLRMFIGLAQTGGFGGWTALEPSDSLSLLPNGGANGNMEIDSIFNAASVPVDLGVEHCEGY